MLNTSVKNLDRPSRWLAVAAGVFVLSASGAEAAPAMWRMSDADTTLYLFGTVHLMSARVEWRTAVFETALKDAGTIILEADVTSPDAIRRMGEIVGEHAINPPA